jgi:hypothetical protein
VQKLKDTRTVIEAVAGLELDQRERDRIKTEVQALIAPLADLGLHVKVTPPRKTRAEASGDRVLAPASTNG